MLLFALLSFIAAEIFVFDDKREEISITLDIVGKKICKGYFKPMSGENYMVKSVIYSGVDRVLFSNGNLPENTETHYSFNTGEEQSLTMKIKAIKIDSSKKNSTPPEVEMTFTTQFDTFDKEVARNVSVEPAMFALTNLDNILLKMIHENEELIARVGRVDYEHKRLFSYMTIFSVIILIFYVVVNVYEIQSLKKFLKTKKMI